MLRCGNSILYLSVEHIESDNLLRHWSSCSVIASCTNQQLLQRDRKKKQWRTEVDSGARVAISGAQQVLSKPNTHGKSHAKVSQCNQPQKTSQERARSQLKIDDRCNSRNTHSVETPCTYPETLGPPSNDTAMMYVTIFLYLVVEKVSQCFFRDLFF